MWLAGQDENSEAETLHTLQTWRHLNGARRVDVASRLGYFATELLSAALELLLSVVEAGKPALARVLPPKQWHYSLPVAMLVLFFFLYAPRAETVLPEILWEGPDASMAAPEPCCFFGCL